MDFFEAQARAKKRTNRLVFLFVLAVIGTIFVGYAAAIFLLHQTSGRGGRHSRYSNYYTDTPAQVSYWDPRVFTGVALGTLAIVGLASLYKWSQMREGGAAVAEMVGGRRLDPHTTDLTERRLLNVVEEMAIASGLPMPAVYVLDQEPGINAFAAGLTTSDAVVTVTRGTLDKLTRDELQGVIGHEFSHILNGDMRLNVKLTAILFGILVIGLLGRGILYSMGRGRVRSDDRKGGGLVAILGIGLALMIVGYVGYFFGKLIQAAVSRQREFLADASSVQFTRNPGGITGALKKIGGYTIGSDLTHTEAAQFSHFFFAQGFRSNFGGLWATHPALDERIRAVDPQFDGKFVEPPEVVDVAHESFLAAGLVAKRPTPPAPHNAIAAMAMIGSLTPQHVEYAQTLLAQVPPALRDAARSPTDAAALVYALLLDEDAGIREKQFALIGSLDGSAALDSTRALLPAVAQTPAASRMPLVSLTLPSLHNLSDGDLKKFDQTTDALIMADGTVSVFEFMIQKALLRHVVRARQPDDHHKPEIFSLPAVARETGLVLSIMANAAGESRGTQVAAFAAGISQLPQISAQLAFTAADTWDFKELDAALNKLGTASDPIKQQVLFAAAHVVSQDGVILPVEAELLRAVSDALGCPMPPLIAAA
jgi:Zn-dependent protease with chaperone function